MRNAGGPAAVIGASGESWAAPGQLAMDGLLRAAPSHLFHAARGLLAVGPAGLAKGEIEEMMFKLFDQFDGSQGKVSLAVQRREHLEMWMLLGDPALHLPLTPVDIAMEVPATIGPGGSITVKGSVPGRLAGAVVRVTWSGRINSLPAGLENCPRLPPKTARTANGWRWRIAGELIIRRAGVRRGAVGGEQICLHLGGAGATSLGEINCAGKRGWPFRGGLGSGRAAGESVKTFDPLRLSHTG